MSALLELGAGFHPELSGRENVFLNGSILGMSRREIASRFDSIVEFAGLEKFIDTPVKNYSSGMFVRLGFSVAITVEPDILLVDEVLAVGDESFQQRCLDKFAALRDAGHTIVVVSHGLESIRNLCDQVAWLDHGRILGQGKPGQVVESYLESVRQARTSDAPPSSEESEAGWGIDAVELRSGGNATSELRSGAQLDIHISFTTARTAPITIVVDITRADGVHVAGLAHRFDAGDAGTHQISCAVPALPFTQGIFDVSVALLDEHRTRTHARWTRAARVTIVDADAEASGGLVALQGRGPTLIRLRRPITPIPRDHRLMAVPEARRDDGDDTSTVTLGEVAGLVGLVTVMVLGVGVARPRPARPPRRRPGPHHHLGRDRCQRRSGVAVDLDAACPRRPRRAGPARRGARPGRRAVPARLDLRLPRQGPGRRTPTHAFAIARHGNVDIPDPVLAAGLDPPGYSGGRFPGLWLDTADATTVTSQFYHLQSGAPRDRS